MEKIDIINIEQKLINSTIYRSSFKKIIFFISHLINNIVLYIKENNIKTVIGIGDSPAIFITILNLHLKNIKLPCKIYYFPISSLNIKCKNCTNSLEKKFMFLNKLSLKKNLLWLDFVATGVSFNFIHKLLPKEIKKKSYYFLYGFKLNNLDYAHKYILNLIKKKKVYYLNTINTEEETFLGEIIGYSEGYNIRCIRHKKVNEKNFEVKLYNNLDNIYIKNSNCLKISEHFYKILFKRNLLNYK